MSCNPQTEANQSTGSITSELGVINFNNLFNQCYIRIVLSATSAVNIEYKF